MVEKLQSAVLTIFVWLKEINIKIFNSIFIFYFFNAILKNNKNLPLK